MQTLKKINDETIILQDLLLVALVYLYTSTIYNFPFDGVLVCFVFIFYFTLKWIDIFKVNWFGVAFVLCMVGYVINHVVNTELDSYIYFEYYIAFGKMIMLNIVATSILLFKTDTSIYKNILFNIYYGLVSCTYTILFMLGFNSLYKYMGNEYYPTGFTYESFITISIIFFEYIMLRKVINERWDIKN